MYYITISNGLLEGTHQKKMGSSVWQFMWCIDKITIINEKGEGKVWGGKPIKLKDIQGASERTNSRNLNKLARLGYVKLTHTPYGISIMVFKAKKVFNRRVDNSGVPKRSDISGVPLTKIGVPNKTIHLDKTPKTPAKAGVKMKYKENTIDYETGEPILQEDKPKKNKEAIRLALMFDEMATEFLKQPIITPKSYFIVLNAINTHDMTPAGIEKLYYDWFYGKNKRENKGKLSFALSANNINEFKVKHG